jgi:hypothetical protein
VKKKKKHGGQPTRRSTRIATLQEEEEAPNSPATAALPEEHDPTLVGTSYTFVSTTSVIPHLNNCETLLLDLRGQVEDEQAEFNLRSTRAWYDGRSSSCEGDSSNEEVCSTYIEEGDVEEGDVEDGFTLSCRESLP